MDYAWPGHTDPFRATFAVPAERSPITRWLPAVGLVLGLTLLGVGFSVLRGPQIGISFSARVAMVYCPVAAALILGLAWSARTFPYAAAVYYGFLGVGQAVNVTYHLLGDDDGAVTLEMVLALPLLAAAWLGPRASAAHGDQPLPGKMRTAWLLVAAAAVCSTALARAPDVAVYTFAGRFVVPMLVALGTFRRLRSVADYQIVWFGFLAGFLAVGVFDFQRAVMGELPWYAAKVGQRHAGATGSFAIPTFYVVGPALWLGHALAMRRSILTGSLLLAMAGVFGVLLWIGGHRGPLVFFAVLVAWWLPGHFFRHLFRIQNLILLIIGVVSIAWVVRYSLERTTLDTSLIVERFLEMRQRGIREESRWILWKRGLDYWAASPLTGLGLNNWVVVDDHFESVHSSAVGILIDTGLLGALGFGLLFGTTLTLVRARSLTHLTYEEQRFVLGCRAAWVVLLLLLCTNLPFTSGRPQNYVFAHTVFFFPVLAMTVHARRRQFAGPSRAPGWSPAGVPPGPFVATPAARPPGSPTALPATPGIMPACPGPTPAP